MSKAYVSDERLDDRIEMLRRIARKHGVDPDDYRELIRIDMQECVQASYWHEQTKKVLWNRLAYIVTMALHIGGGCALYYCAAS